jgi:hypothetical protein
MRAFKILLVENEQYWQTILQEHIQQALTELDHPNDLIQIVENIDEGKQALEDKGQYNLLVTDIASFSHLPEMKVIELVKQADQLNMATILISDQEITETLRNDIFKYQIIDYFHKETYYTRIKDFILKVKQVLKEEISRSRTRNEREKDNFDEIWNKAQNAIEQTQLEIFKSETDKLTKLLCQKIQFRPLEDIATFEQLYGRMIDASNPAFQLNIPFRFPVIYACQKEFNQEQIKQIIGLLNEFEIYAKYFALFVIFSDRENLYQLIHQSPYANNFIIFDRDQIWNILAAESSLKQLTDYILEKIDLKAVSPYICAGPVKTKMFFGREQEKKTLIENISLNNYAILANRKMGKTSLLNQIFPILNENSSSKKVFYCDLQPVFNYENFYENLALSYPDIETEIAKFNPLTPQKFSQIIKYIKKQNNDCQIILIFDEVDKLLSHDLNNQEQLFGVFRSFPQSENVHFIFSGTKELTKRCHHPDSPLFNFCQIIELDFLDEKPGTDLIINPMESLNVKFETKNASVESILSITARHPNLIQYLCDSLIKIISNKQERTITQRDIENVINSGQFYTYCEAVIWGKSEAIDKLIVYLMRFMPFTESDVIKEFRKRGLETDGVKNSLETLQIYKILYQENGTYCFRYSDFASLIKRRKNTKKIGSSHSNFLAVIFSRLVMAMTPFSTQLREEAEIEELVKNYQQEAKEKENPKEQSNIVKADIAKGVEEGIKNLLSGPILNNFQGSVQASFLNSEGVLLSCSQEGLPKILPEDRFKLSVKFSPETPVEEESSGDRIESNFSKRISIRDGEDSQKVVFDVVLDSDTVTIIGKTKNSATIQIDPPTENKKLFFDLKAPNTYDIHKIWIEIYQKNKLIQVIPLKIIVDLKVAIEEENLT